jgi:dihydropteroate synthase
MPWRVGPGLLRCRTFEWRPTPREPLVMGVVNASPDSFSDGGELGDLEAQVERAMALVAAGADIIDVGGESGVTDTPVSGVALEVGRVVPLVGRLAERGVCVSVDTWKPEVAAAALDAGASMINDVSGLQAVELVDLCAARGAGLVIMHTRAAPKTKVVLAYEDVVADVSTFLADRLHEAAERGLAAEHVVLDPGPDFAKTPAQSVEVLRRLPQLAVLGRPLLLALSRKDFLGALTNRRPRDRLAGTLAALGEGLDAGGSILRVHDVAAVRDFLCVRAAMRGWKDVPERLRLADHLRRQRVSDDAPEPSDG